MWNDQKRGGELVWETIKINFLSWSKLLYDDDDDQVEFLPVSPYFYFALLSVSVKVANVAKIARKAKQKKLFSMKRLNLSEFKSNKICNKHVSLIASCV